MSAPLVSACLLATVAAALIGCETLSERDYDRRVVETRPAGPLTGTSRPAPTALSPSQDEAEPVQRVVQRGAGTFLSPPVRRAQASITIDGSC